MIRNAAKAKVKAKAKSFRLACASLISGALLLGAGAAFAEGAKQVRPQQAGAFERLDRNHDAYLSKKEVKGTKLEAHFSVLDTNRDRQLSRAELAAARKVKQPVIVPSSDCGTPKAPKQLGTPKPGPAPASFFARLDQNHDAYLSRKEVKGTKLEARFSVLDTNRDRQLSRAELAAARKALPSGVGRGHGRG